MPVRFRSGWTCQCVATSLPLVERIMLARGLINESLDIFQLGYRTDVDASAGTHAAGGCTDVAQFTDDQIDVWRWAGWTMQHRTKAQGFDPHAHGWPFGCPHLSPGARKQAEQWKNQQNGLISRGPVQGRWPVVGWKTGVTRMENELTAFADEIVAETVKKLSDLIKDVPRKVLTTDGILENVYTGNDENKFVALQTALATTFRRADAAVKASAEHGQKLDVLTTQLGELSAKVDGLTPPADPAPPVV